jgi:hypothetical protein
MRVGWVFIAEFDGMWGKMGVFGGIFDMNKKSNFLFKRYIQNIQRILIFTM